MSAVMPTANLSAPAPDAGAGDDELALAWTIVLREAVTDLVWDAAGTRVFAASADGELAAFRADGDTAFQIPAHSAPITRLRLQPGRGDEALLASAGEDGGVRLWRARDGAPVADFSADFADGADAPPGWVEHLDWSADGASLAAASAQRVQVRDVDGGFQNWDGHPGAIGALAWSPGGRRLASAANKGVYLWNVGSWEPVRVLGFPGAAISLAWSPDGHALAAGTQDGFLHVRVQVPTGKPSQLSMSGYPGKVGGLAWHPRPPKGRMRLASCGGRDVVLWDLDLRKGSKRATPLRAHERSVSALAYAPGGERLASADRGGRLCLWNAGNALVAELGLGAEVTALRWRPDGRQLAVGDVDGGLRLFSLEPDPALPVPPAAPAA